MHEEDMTKPAVSLACFLLLGGLLVAPITDALAQALDQRPVSAHEPSRQLIDVEQSS
jgi:hypothetical protein